MGYPMPGRSAGILNRSHGVRAEAFAAVNGSGFAAPLPVVGTGTVAVDMRSNTRRKLKLRVEASIDSPRVSVLTAEVRPFYVLVDDPSGVEYAIPAGTFVITEAKESSPGVVELTGEDRWRRVLDARFPRPVTTSGNTVTAITSLLQGADGRISVTVDPGVNTLATHRPSVWERDRDKAVNELAQSIGATVFFDPLGVAHIAPLPSLSQVPYWQITTGPGGARLGRSRGLSRSRTYNAAAVVGDPGNGVAPVYGFAADDDPASATRYGGPFGKRPRFYKSSLVSTQAQADSTAASLLASVKGITRTLNVQSLTHPGLDAGDVIFAETDPGVFHRFLVGGFTLPLGLGSLDIDALTDYSEDGGEEA